jgi:hypothetical protein
MAINYSLCILKAVRARFGFEVEVVAFFDTQDFVSNQC